MNNSNAEFQFLDFKAHSRASRPPTLEKKGSAAPSEVRKSKRRAKDYTPHVDAFVLCMGAIIFVLWLEWFAS